LDFCSFVYEDDYDNAIDLSITGTWLENTTPAETLTLALSILGTYGVGGVWKGDALQITLSLKEPYVETAAKKKNWVGWSDIGSMSFTINRKNVAGERPLDWTGWVYAIKKLGSRPVVYGQNGVSYLLPANNVYGLQTIYRLGLKGRHAVCGTESEHYFVDAEGQLFRLADSLERLDYSEYLDGLASTIVLSYDLQNGFIYICDGTQGYVYSPADKSLGEGPTNISGIGSQGGTLYVAAPAAISTPAFEICFDIYDFGTRNGKTIRSIEIGTDLTGTLQAAIDYRREKSDPFSTTTWRTVNSEGKAFINAYGVEFRPRIRVAAYEYFELDYITINGEIHAH
jgi:hypothetical protein